MADSNGETKSDLKHLKEDMSAIKQDIKSMSKTIETIAVQKNRLDSVEKQVEELWRYHRSLIEPCGVISVIKTKTGNLEQRQTDLAEEFNKSRKWQWTVIAFQAVALLGIAAKACLV
jgi:DNA repair exonuclease SbcCD ATPase subunit